MRRRALTVYTLLAGLAVLAAGRADAEGSALVIGVATYAGQPTVDGCTRTARDVADALRHRGLDVATSIDAPSSMLRNKIDDFSAKIADAPGVPAVVYVCGAADAVDGRVFLLPADVDLRRAVHAQTEGIVLHAALGALTGANGLFAADLALRTAPDAQRIAATLRAGSPGGAVLAVQGEPADGIGALGRALGRALAGAAKDDWTSAREALQAEVAANAHSALAVFEAPAPPADAAASASSNATPSPVTEAARASAQEPDQRAATRPPALSKPVTHANARMRRIQAALAQHGAFQRPPDTRGDSKTLDAIRRYQTSIGDRPTGVLTEPEILNLLNAR